MVLIAYAPLASGRLARRVVEQPNDVGGTGSRVAKPKAAFTLVPPLLAPDKRGFGAGAEVANLVPLLRMLDGGGGSGGVPAHAALRWLVSHDNVLAIPGCKTAAQVCENLGANDAADLPPEQIEALGAAGRAANQRTR